MKKLLLLMLIIVLFTGCVEEEKNIKEKTLVNTEEGIIKKQVVDVFEFKNTSLIYANETTTLETTVTNISDIDQTIEEFSIIVKDKRGKELITLIGYVGNTLKSGESRVINSNCRDNLIEAGSIEYKIIK